MRLIQTAPLAAAFLVAACGGDADTNDDGTVSSEEVVAEAAGAIKPQPGQYRVLTEVLEYRVPGVPEAVQEQILEQMLRGGGAAREITFCLTPEQAAANGPEQMAKNMATGNCAVSKFDVSGGTVSAEMQCAGANGAPSQVTMDGTMTPTSSTMTMSLASEGDAQGAGRLQMKTRVTSERIGECP